MPRVESVKHIGTQFYHSQFTNSHYLPADSSSSSASPPSSPISILQTSPRKSANNSSGSGSEKPAKKKHICQVCDRAFTTSGHLARHSRVHTGERNHKCPFPGCETRCSRQDNLQQHYRIHLSPGSRRSSTRSASARAKKGSQPPPPLTESMPSTPPLSPAPALEPARLYSLHSSPPNSPPALAHATLPATATLPTNAYMDSAGSDCSSSSAGSPQTSYSSPNHHIAAPMSSQQQQSQSYSGSAHQTQSQSNNSSEGYSYRNGTTTYQEQSPSQGSGAYTYVHTTPISTSSGSSNGGSFSSYGTQQDGYTASMQQQQQQQNANGSANGVQSQTRVHSPHSRHSISHISHPQSSYSQHHQQQHHQHHHQTSSAGPASPASTHSVHSHTSGPPTPTYTAVFQPQPHQNPQDRVNGGSGHVYQHSSSLIAAAPPPAEHTTALHNPHNNIHAQPQPQTHLMQSTYSSSLQGANPTSPAGGGTQQQGGAGRFESPPPILAPIQDVRIIKRQHYPTHSHSHSHSQAQAHAHQQHGHGHNGSQYIHAPQPQPMQAEYATYHHHSLALGHGAWKGENGMRKDVGAALV